MWALWLTFLAAAVVAVVADEGKMTTVMMYRNSSCGTPAMTVSFRPQLICPTPSNTCTNNGMFYSSSDCWDYPSSWWYLQSVFNWEPFLIVEKFDSSVSWCGNNNYLEESNAHLLDGKCHVSQSGTTSSRITLGDSLLFATYDDPYCDFQASETEVTWAMVNRGNCVDGSTRFQVGGPSPNMSVVAIFEDDTCSGKPVKLTFQKGFGCLGNQDRAKSACKPYGSSHYSISSCAGAYAYSDFVSDAFGSDSPYLLVEKAPDSMCDIDSGAAYTADGTCHSNPDDATSFRVALTAQSTVEFSTFLDPACVVVDNSTVVSKSTLMSYSCVWDSQCGDKDGTKDGSNGCAYRYSVGGLGGVPARGRMTTLAMYGNSSCGAPAMTVSFKPQLTCPVPSNECTDNGMFYSSSDCWDYFESRWSLDSVFNWESFLHLCPAIVGLFRNQS